MIVHCWPKMKSLNSKTHLKHRTHFWKKPSQEGVMNTKIDTEPTILTTKHNMAKEYLVSYATFTLSNYTIFVHMWHMTDIGSDQIGYWATFTWKYISETCQCSCQLNTPITVALQLWLARYNMQHSAYERCNSDRCHKHPSCNQCSESSDPPYNCKLV